MAHDLERLARLLEAAPGPSDFLDAALRDLAGAGPEGSSPTSSVAEASRFIEDLAPSLTWSIQGLVGESRCRLMSFDGVPRLHGGVAGTPALALLAAFVRYRGDLAGGSTPPEAT